MIKQNYNILDDTSLERRNETSKYTFIAWLLFKFDFLKYRLVTSTSATTFVINLGSNSLLMIIKDSYGIKEYSALRFERLKINLDFIVLFVAGFSCSQTTSLYPRDSTY